MTNYTRYEAGSQGYQQSQLHRKQRKISKNFTQTDLGVSKDWFEPDLDFEINSEEKFSIGLWSNRLLIYTSKGDFSVPRSYLDVPFIGKGISDILEDKGISLEAELRKNHSKPDKMPRLILSNAHALRKLSSFGYDFISPTLDVIYRTYGVEKTRQITGYLFNYLIRQNPKKLNFKLKTDTAYFQNKAQELSALRNVAGGGQWELVNIEYHPEKSGLCTMGHKVSYKFIVREKTTGIVIGFGSHCVEDFFDINQQTKGHLSAYKIALFNAMLEYGLQHAPLTQMHLWVDTLQVSFLHWLANTYGVSDRAVLETARKFLVANIKMPETLVAELSRVAIDTGVLKTKFKNHTILERSLVALGILGTNASLVPFKDRHVTDKSYIASQPNLHTVKMQFNFYHEVLGSLSLLDSFTTDLATNWYNLIAEGFGVDGTTIWNNLHEAVSQRTKFLEDKDLPIGLRSSMALTTLGVKLYGVGLTNTVENSNSLMCRLYGLEESLLGYVFAETLPVPKSSRLLPKGSKEVALLIDLFDKIAKKRHIHADEDLENKLRPYIGYPIPAGLHASSWLPSINREKLTKYLTETFPNTRVSKPADFNGFDYKMASRLRSFLVDNYDKANGLDTAIMIADSCIKYKRVSEKQYFALRKAYQNITSTAGVVADYELVKAFNL